MATAPSSTPENTLRAQIFQRLHPKAYLERFLSEELRPDGREKEDWRDVSFNVGTRCTSKNTWDPIINSNLEQAQYLLLMALRWSGWDLQQ